MSERNTAGVHIKALEVESFVQAAGARTATRRPVIEFLGMRRSAKLRALRDPGPSDDELAQILTVASRVPDHGNLVPWRFVVITGDRRNAISETIGECYEAENPTADERVRTEMRRRLVHAPLVVAVVACPKPHPKVPEWEQVLSAGAVCMNLLWGAKALGYGGLWLTEWYAYDRCVLDELGIGADERVAGFMHIGTAQEAREDRVRPELADIVTVY